MSSRGLPEHAPVGIEDAVGDFGNGDSDFSICAFSDTEGKEGDTSEGYDSSLGATPCSPLYYFPPRYTRGIMGYSPLGEDLSCVDRGGGVGDVGGG